MISVPLPALPPEMVMGVVPAVNNAATGITFAPIRNSATGKAGDTI